MPGASAKRRLPGRDPLALVHHAEQLRRGEVAHWWSVIAAPVLAFASPAVVVVPMLVVALAVNVPCIVALRFNRRRIAYLLAAPHRRRAERDADR